MCYNISRGDFMKKILLLLIITFFICGCSTTMEGSNSDITCDMKDKLMEKDNTYLIDVREKEEFDEYHLKDAINIPLGNIIDDISKDKNIDTNSNIIVYCRSGKRSTDAFNKLKSAGYKNIYNLGAISKCNKE